MYCKVIIIAVVCANLVWADTSNGARFMTLSAGSRYLGMGEVSVTSVSDIFSISSNPASLGRLKSSQLGLVYYKTLEDSFFAYMGYAFPLSKTDIIGCSLSYYDGGNFEYNSVEGVTSNFKAERDILLTFSAARSFEGGRQAGISLKLIRAELVEQYTALAFAVDAGVNYRISEKETWRLIEGLTGLKIENDEIWLGINVRNLGTKLKFINEGDLLPAQLSTGIAYRFEAGRDKKFEVAFDLCKPLDSYMRMHFGLEVVIDDMFAIRGGLKTGSTGLDLTAGAGFKLEALTIDYSAAFFTSGWLNHMVSLVYSFEEKGRQAKRPPSNYNKYRK
ncbi:MAG: hypothetical protein A2231_00440 [Candidatus Firestonebacteria bacterium RIFOXYA2_FULL_40_8]|nr:MAG: hypothetical protein A2231_00440 [Candidatus Firestonebacteria bacterium RIFOXYA2_FULL_40_8]